METEKKFFVYVDFREDDGRPFYVGKGVEKRVKDLHRNHLHTRIKNKHGIVRKILLETFSEQEAFQKETELIQELKTYVDFGEGGANLTLGGEGGSGYKFTNEQRKKMWENPEFREKIKPNHKPEVIKKISEASKKMWENPEFRKRWEDPEFQKKKRESHRKAFEKPEIKKRLSENSKKRWEDPEHKKLISDSMKKVWEDPEHREKVSNALNQKYSDPEFRKKLGEKIREALSDPEIREKISRTTKEKLSDPEIRKKISENVKLGISKLTPEQRSERIRKGWETRRLQKLQQES